jgi:hypothetical protein
MEPMLLALAVVVVLLPLVVLALSNLHQQAEH